jgi:hypothetical protein
MATLPFNESDVGGWLERACQLREIAVQMDDALARQHLLELAAKWAGIACLAADRALAGGGLASDTNGDGRTASLPDRYGVRTEP